MRKNKNTTLKIIILLLINSVNIIVFYILHVPLFLYLNYLSVKLSNGFKTLKCRSTLPFDSKKDFRNCIYGRLLNIFRFHGKIDFIPNLKR